GPDETPRLPSEAVCGSCHDVEDPTLCTDCHLAGSDGRLIQHFDGDRLTPPQQLRPADHDESWAMTHGSRIAADATPCFVCHQERECVGCHTDGNFASSPHPPGFLSIHGPAARSMQTECSSCHSAQNFCADCHLDVGVSDIERTLGAGLPSHHPPGWVSEAGGRHAAEAQFNIMACATCHQEDTCAQCHVEVNPHGAEFYERCGRLLRTSPSLCAQCHESNETSLSLRCR
ncbi:MAG: hypothetical protein KC561_08240, partial [Myxococcales bacterium]|nr:hypothetical protein [Myxococcales bacterium]